MGVVTHSPKGGLGESHKTDTRVPPHPRVQPTHLPKCQNSPKTIKIDENIKKRTKRAEKGYDCLFL